MNRIATTLLRTSAARRVPALTTAAAAAAPRLAASLHTTRALRHPTIGDFDVLGKGAARSRVNVQRFSDKGFYVVSSTPTGGVSDPTFLRGPILLVEGQALLWDVPTTEGNDPMHGCLATWTPEMLTVFEVMKNKPEIVVFGTGKALLALPKEVRDVFASNGMQVEVSNTRNACSTFNVLVAEGRHVAACLLPLSPAAPLRSVPAPSPASVAASAVITAKD
ncbi:hypothetical protein H9P43_009247 [Blastocladiella emersonii ATCC 22665]|nr:hypothetical protein H9P43_009247 [Blastocladiella emersonii ATCC 22665]